MKKLLVIALLALFALPSCTKYEEGPFFSLRTKSQRVQNDWTAILYEVDGTNILQEFDVLYFFDKERVRLQYYHSGSLFQEAEGDWRLTHDKEWITIEWDQAYGGEIFNLEIIRLKEKELWVEYEGDRWEFVPR